MSMRELMPSWLTSRDRNDVFGDLHNEVDRVFSQFRTMLPVESAEPVFGRFANQTVPKMNVAETDKAYEVEVELPGVEKDDVDVSVDGHSLVIEGHKKRDSEKTEKDYKIVERSEGKFMRTINLGFEADDKDVDANFKDGVLNVMINKPADLAKKKKKIPIKKSEPA